MGKFNLRKLWSLIPMWMKIWFGGLLMLGALFVAGCNIHWFKFYPQDNFVEESVEDYIKKETGIDVDLTPFSKESAYAQG